MWNKIYLILLAAAILTVSGLTFFAYSKLQSTGFAPAVIAENYGYYANFNWLLLWISTLILLLTANVILWKTRKSWALWVLLAYFAVFTVLQTFWLGQLFFRFKQENNFTSDILSFSSLTGVMLIVLMTIIVFFNQYIVKRIHDKMYPANLPPENSLIEEIGNPK